LTALVEVSMSSHGACRAKPAHQVGGQRHVDLLVGVRAQHVVVVGDQVDLLAPAQVVQRLEVRGHEVRGDRLVADGADGVPLGAVELEQGVGAEPVPVQLLGRVALGRGDPGRDDLVPVAVPLAPEGGAPGVVQGVQVGVPALQPPAERRAADVAEALGDVAAVLVVDVPHPQRGVVR
jgi:hypothetical protein